MSSYPTNPLLTANMTEQQRVWFFAEYESARKDEVVGVLLAVFLGCFGIHQFYLHRNGLGTLYLIFSWTGIPAILGLIDCFFMPRRVAEYNAAQASYIASRILNESPFQPPPPQQTASNLFYCCRACGQSIDNTAAYCPHCGTSIAM